MVSKKRNPPPPSPTNSSEVEEEEVEEEIEEEEEEEEVKKGEEEGYQGKAKPSSSSGEDTEGESDEEESDEDEDQSTSHPVQPSSQDGKKSSTGTQRQATPPPAAVPNSGSEEEAETESEEEDEEDPGLTNEESESTPLTASAYTVKPIALPENTKGSKTTPKRSLESSKDDVKVSGNRKKAKTGEENDKKGKGATFTRIWSEANEIVVLEGMCNYQKQKGPYRSADLGIFYEFIKGKLWDGITKNQIGDKLKRLKGKYLLNVRKGKNGQDPTFTKLHEKKAFDLSKQIWGGGIESNGVEEKAKPKVDNGKGKKVSSSLIEISNGIEEKTKTKPDNGKGKNVSSAGSESKRVEDNKRVSNEEAKLNLQKDDELMDDDKQDFVSKFPTLCVSFDAEAGLLKNNLHLIGNQKARELEGKWKQLQVEEMNLLAKRLNMKSELINLVLDAMRKQ